MLKTLIGRRVFPTPEGYLVGLENPGDYGQATDRNLLEKERWWQVITPDGHHGCLNPNIHRVIEHDDGTITVYPNITTASWNGRLEHGEWRSAAFIR